jgi:hypothetical protein
MDNKFMLMRLRLNQFLWMCLGGIILIISFTACGALQPRYPSHGIVTKNIGNERLSDLVIDYGYPIIFRDSTPVRPGSQTNSGGDNPIPDNMIVSWKTADSKEHKATVQLKGKLNYVEELRAIELWFADEKLEVYQATKSGARGEFTNRRRIYPE